MKLSLILFLSAVGRGAAGRDLAFSPGEDGDGPDEAFAPDDPDEAFAAEDPDEAFAPDDPDEAFNPDNAFSFTNDCDAGRFYFSVPADTDPADVFDSSPCPVTDSLYEQFGVQTPDMLEELIEAAIYEGEANQDVPFESITNDFQLDKNYFDGNSNWNNEVKMDATGGAIPRTWDAFGSSHRITWPVHVDNFHDCEARVAMCCFADNLGDDFAPNSQICSHDLAKSATSSHIKSGYSLFTGGNNAYCTSFAWSEDETHVQSKYKGNMLFWASMYNGRFLEKQAKNVPSTPMCGCIEKMPIVSTTECMQVKSEQPMVNIFVTPDDARVEFDASLSFGACFEESFVDHYAGVAGDEEIDELEATNFLDDCEDVVADFYNSKFLVSGTTEDPVDLTKWTKIVGHGKHYYPSKGETFFRDALANSPNGIVYRYCPSCRDYAQYNHKHIYYKRLTEIPSMKEVDFLDLFMNNWFKEPANLLNEDFSLHATYEDAVSGENPWQWCNYDDPNIGFPRECGPTQKSDHQWNVYVKNHWSSAHHHAYYVEKAGPAGGGPDMAF